MCRARGRAGGRRRGPAAEVADQRADVLRLVEEARKGVVVGALERREQGVANVLDRGAEERLVRLVRHLVDSAAEEAASLPRVRLAQLAAVLRSITSQPLDRKCDSSSDARIPGITRSSEWRLRSTIQSALPSPRVSGSATASQRLPSSRLRVAEQGDVAATRRGAEVGGDVPVGERSEQRGGAPQADQPVE